MLQRKPSLRPFVLITAAGLALILYLRLIPFELVWEGRVPLERWTIGPLTLRDGPLNVLLFIPFGFGLAGLLTQPATSNEQRTTWAVLFISLGLSATLEVIQLFMPARAPSFSDVAANGLGALAGALLFLVWAMGFGHAFRSFINRRYLIPGLILYILSAYWLTEYLDYSVSLGNWDASFPLVVGNEANGQRPWRGRIEELSIAAWKFGEEAHYPLTGTAPFEDVIQLHGSPPLVWQEGPVTPQDGEGCCRPR
jgi:glycopeptide antibiotics resistance protein